jgi:hypothetical protein
VYGRNDVVGIRGYDGGRADLELSEFLVIVPEGAGLLGTPGGVVFGVEEQDHGLSIQEIFEGHRVTSSVD